MKFFGRYFFPPAGIAYGAYLVTTALHIEAVDRWLMVTGGLFLLAFGAAGLGANVALARQRQDPETLRALQKALDGKS